MKFRIYEVSKLNFRFRIEEDLPGIGWYIYIYKDDILLYDYLQDTLEVSKNFVNDRYEINDDDWRFIGEFEV